MKKDHLLIFSFVLVFLLTIIFNAYLPSVAKVINFVTFWMLIAVIVYRVLINRRKRWRREFDMAIKKYYPFLLVIGLLFWLSVFILPADFLSAILGNFRWGGVVGLIINPIIGVICLLLALRYKNYWIAGLSILLAGLLPLAITLFGF